MPLSRSRNRFLWILLVIFLVIGAWFLFSLYQTDAFNIRATIKGSPVGIAQAIAAESGTGGTGGTGDTETGSGTEGSGDTGTGSGNGGTQGKGTELVSGPDGTQDTGIEPEPVLEDGPLLGIVNIGGQGNRVYINTDIDYGTVFPGESFTGHFIIYLTGVDEDDWEGGPYSELIYTITLLEKSPYEDMRPYLTVEKATEGDSETDWIADGPNDDYDAEGNLSGSDTSDKWWVTFTVPDDPDEFGEYQADILVEVPDAPD